MNSIKTLAIVAMLGALGVGLYIKINSTPPPEPPPAATGTWDAPPPIDMGTLDPQMSGGVEMEPLSEDPLAGGGMAPSFDAAQSGGVAPVYSPSSGAEVAPPFDAGAAGGSAPPFEPSNAAEVPSLDASANPPQTAVGGSAKKDAPAVDSSASVNKDPFVQPVSGTQPVERTPPSEPAAASYDQVWEQARQFLRQGQLDVAHKLLSSSYGDPSLTPVQQEQLVDLLSQLAGTLIYSTEHHLEPPYVARAGETLEEIAARYRVTPQLLAKINGLSDPGHLQPGQELKVVRGPFMAVISVSKRELTLALDGRYAGRFPIGIGQEWEPVDGEFEVKSKFTNPTYYGRAETLDADDPNNPLGEHWLGLVSTDNSFTGPLGIHGTNDPANVQSESDPRGYIRLSPQDAEDVFDILTEGARVIIRR